MRKFLFIVTLAFFCALTTQAFAAPAQNARQGGGASTKRVATQKSGSKATSKRATTRNTRQGAQQRTTAAQAQKTTAQQRQEARNQEFGLMPSEIDNTNHSIFRADATAIKGARETEQALRYLPFVTLINTAGFGYSFDLRGQGRLSANGVKLYINGVPANPTDSYFNPMPIQTILPQLIHEVQVYPGGGAVLYGSGAKGGTINIITSKRNAPYYLVGAGYVNTMATTGNSFNAFAQAAENLGPHLKVNAGLGISVLGGPREDDDSKSGQANVGAWYDIGWGQSVSVDADVFYNKTKTTPYNSLLDYSTINEFMLSHISTPRTTIQGGGVQEPYEQSRYYCLSGDPRCGVGVVNDFEPDSGDRADKGYGDIETTTIRATANVNYLAQLTEKLKFNALGYGNFQSRKYDTHKMNTPFFVLGFVNPNDTTQRGYNWFLPRPTHPYRTGAATPGSAGMDNITMNEEDMIGPEGPIFGGELGDGERADWHLIDQSGSKFDDYKFGGKAQIDWLHNNGLFIFGMDVAYDMSKRNSKTYLRQAIVDGSAMAGVRGYNNNSNDTGLRYGSNSFRNLVANITDKTDINVLTVGAYAFERYDFNRNLSLGMGMRYELKNYDVKITDNFEGYKMVFQNTNNNSGVCAQGGNCDFVDYNSGTIAPTYGLVRDENGRVASTYAKTAQTRDIATHEAKGEYSQNHDNFTFELAPVYRYSNTGAIYARGEFGYNAPPAWAMLRRIGIVWGAAMQRDVWLQFTPPNQQTDPTPYGDVLEFDFAFENTDLKNETYYTAELGWKEMIGTRRVPLGITNLTLNALLFNASVFYTASTDEFYFEGDTWSGMTFGNYDKSRRMGVELTAEQYLFDGALGFNESFTYLKAQYQDATSGWTAIPYTYDWKATLGAAVNVSTFLEVVDVDVSIWLQNSIYGNQNIYSTRMNVLDFATAQALAAANGTTINKLPNTTTSHDQEPYFVSQRQNDKLKPYFVSDFGVSVGINKNMGVVTVGVKNVFDTFYYDYYNNDRSAVVNENRYVIGRGRTVFVEGTFRY